MISSLFGLALVPFRDSSLCQLLAGIMAVCLCFRLVWKISL